MWHIDTIVIRLLDGTRAYLQAVIDNFSRRILAWRVADTFAPVNSAAVLVEASKARHVRTAPGRDYWRGRVSALGHDALDRCRERRRTCPAGGALRR